MYAALPRKIQRLAKDACKLFFQDPNHPSFRRHELDQRKKGRHLDGTWSVSVTMQYRALYVIKDGVNIWYWIGTHAEYDRFTGQSSKSN